MRSKLAMVVPVHGAHLMLIEIKAIVDVSDGTTVVYTPPFHDVRKDTQAKVVGVEIAERSHDVKVRSAWLTIEFADGERKTITPLHCTIDAKVVTYDIASRFPAGVL